MTDLAGLPSLAELLRYITGLVNWWLGAALAIVGLIDLVQKFTGRDWTWPNRHKASLASLFLVMASLGSFVDVDRKRAALASDLERFTLNEAKAAKEKDERIKALEAANSAPPPQAPGLTFVGPRQVAGHDDAPFAYELIVQTSVTIAPFGIELFTDKPVIGGNLRMTDCSSPSVTLQESVTSSGRSFRVVVGAPGIGPANPWTVVVRGKEPFKIVDAKRIE